MMAPPAVVLSKLPDVMEEIAKVVEVAEDVVEFPVTMSVPLIVEEEFVRRPLVNPMVVPVALPYPTGVNGKMLVSEEEEILLLKRVQSEEER